MGQLEANTWAHTTPHALRASIRSGKHLGPTSGLAPGFLQANLAILPETHASNFLLYCQRNPKSCPLIAVSDPGQIAFDSLGAGIDIRTDLPAYRVFNGEEPFRKVRNLLNDWRDDLVTFVIGCSFSFEEALIAADIPVRHAIRGQNVPMYCTNLETNSAGPFAGPLVVSMRAFKPSHAIQAILLSDQFRLAHGAPVHIGDPALIGISDIHRPDFGDAPIIEPGDILVFWACGVTPQMALRQSGIEIAITHEPGHMLVTDIAAATADTRLAGINYK